MNLARKIHQDQTSYLHLFQIMKFPDIPNELTDTSLALKKKIPDVYEPC